MSSGPGGRGERDSPTLPRGTELGSWLHSDYYLVRRHIILSKIAHMLPKSLDPLSSEVMAVLVGPKNHIVTGS